MLRIISGRWRGRLISTLPGVEVRPTSDRVREAWMSILHGDIPEARVLDICAGSGALGLEALSRGAVSCDFVDKSDKAKRTIAFNLDKLGGHEGARIVRADAMEFVSGLDAGAYDIAFSDPPYSSGIAELLAEGWLSRPFAHILGIEHSSAIHLPEGGDRRRYGSTAITIFR